MNFIHTFVDKKYPSTILTEFSSTPEFYTCEFKILKTYELKDDGSLVEYVKPERMFALQNSCGEICAPEPQSAFEFYITDRPYFEVMPHTGDYRLISEEERERLEAEA